MDAVIISDTHLGTDTCQASNLLDFLGYVEKLAPKELILNGDVFDSWDFRRLKKAHWAVLSAIRSMSDHCHVVWVEGNHDGPAEAISHLIGVDVVTEYFFRSGGKKVLALHGHLFDRFISDHPIITCIADSCYSLLQKLDNSYRLAKIAKHSSKTFLRCSELIEVRAKEYAQKHECEIVCCGHTHNPKSARGSIEYLNSGCWTEKPCHYITIDCGTAKLCDYNCE